GAVVATADGRRGGRGGVWSAVVGAGPAPGGPAPLRLHGARAGAPRRYTSGIHEPPVPRLPRRADVPAGQRGLHRCLRWPAPGPPGAAAPRRRARARPGRADDGAELRAAAARVLRQAGAAAIAA